MGMDLRNIIEELNTQIYDSTQDGTFITFFIALLDLKDNLLHYVNAGHNPPLLVFGNANCFLLETGTTILGPMPKLPFVNEGVMELFPNSILFLYTDGLVETENLEGEQFSEEAVMDSLLKVVDDSPEDINSSLVQKLDDFRQSNAYFDDITLLTCKLN
jgi:sigma-B regulation protein RsbU (phosphoserine phosphatase)